MNMSKAYSNRSACFFLLKMYKECMADTELVLKNGCTPLMMPILDQHDSECLKRIEGEDQQPPQSSSKFSFDPDEKFPCMADLVKFIYTVLRCK